MTPRRRAVSRVSRRISRATDAAQCTRRQPGAPVRLERPRVTTPRPPDGTPRMSGTRVTGQVESPHPAVTSTPLGQSSLGDRDQARAAGAGRDLGIPADVAKKLQDGKLEQACPDCGRWEAAGSYCSGCDRRMGPDDWYRNGDETRRAVAQDRAGEIAATRVKRPRGRPRAASHTPRPDAGFWPV